MAFLLDDLLLFLARKIHEQATEELLDERGVRQQLRELYMSLETGRITDEEFEERERVLVERLEEIEAHKSDQST